MLDFEKSIGHLLARQKVVFQMFVSFSFMSSSLGKKVWQRKKFNEGKKKGFF